MKYASTLILGIALTTASINSHPVQIVRLQVDYSGIPHTLDLELYDTVAPLTVNNFLNYVDDGRYNDTFITRSIPDFVLQTGGYTFRPDDPLNDPLRPIIEGTGLELVPKDLPVINEFNLSNVRGTIALAKLSNDPDSGTSEWFINLSDNSENLDNQNGGFTVFGNVIDDGMVIADEISTFPIQTFAGTVLGPAFSDLPVVDYDFVTLPPPFVYQRNLVMITTAARTTRPILHADDFNPDFGLDIAGDGISKTVDFVFTNTGIGSLTVSAIDQAMLSSPYSILSDNCSNQILQDAGTNNSSQCSIIFEFSTGSTGTFTDELTIGYTSNADASNYSVTVSMTGEGVPSTPTLDQPLNDIVFDDTIINSSTTSVITFRNKGGGNLVLNTITLSGTNSDSFNFDQAGCKPGTILTIGETCDLLVTYAPGNVGLHTASIEITSNAGQSTISISGNATEPVIDIVDSISVVALINQSSSEFVYVTNIGTGNGILTNITISGPDSADFTQENNCPDTNNTDTPTQALGPNQLCGILFEFSPVTPGSKFAIATIESNDPINPIITIDLNGSVENDVDGVPDLVEQSAPNNGDGNNDGIQDDIQSNVASVATDGQEYITLIADEAKLQFDFGVPVELGVPTEITNLKVVSIIPENTPNGTIFDFGLLNFSINLPAGGNAVDVGILYPSSTRLTTYYKYGPTPDNATPHWYDFTYNDDTMTGASYFGIVSINLPGGISIQRNMVIVSFRDGRVGDDDLIENGEVLHTSGGMDLTRTTASASSGSLSIMFLLALVLLRVTRSGRFLYRYC